MAVWMPLDLRPRDASDRGDRYLFTVARLGAGIDAAGASRDLARVASELRHDLPDAYREPAWSLGLVSLRESQFGHMRLSLGVLQGAAAFVLLIACVNVSIMSLLRAVGRRRELAIRFALGAGRAHVARQLLAEAAVLCGLGALAGPRDRECRGLRGEGVRAGGHSAPAGDHAEPAGGPVLGGGARASSR